MNTKSITGIVLAGGRSRRMGSDKSVIQLNGKTLIEYSINAMKPLCDKVVISSNNYIYDYTGCEVWPDETEDQAPIVGIYSCLKRSTTELNIILSCDMPLISTTMLEYLLSHTENHDITVPVHENGLIEPLCGIYRKEAMGVLKKFIEDRNFRLNDSIRASSHQLILVGHQLHFYSPHLFLNINSPEDLQTLLSLEFTD